FSLLEPAEGRRLGGAGSPVSKTRSGGFSMFSIRNWFYLVLAATLTAFALPAQAATSGKIIGLTVTQLSPTTVRTTVQNLTPAGNSNVSSFTVLVHSGGTIVSLIANVGASDGASGNVTVAPDGKSVSVENI